MKKHSFAYIHSNHTTPLIENIKLPFRVKPKEIKDLNRYPFQNYEESIVLFSLTGDELLRKKEEKILRDILSAPPKTIFLIITPFNFEAKTDLNWVRKQLKMLHENKVNFEELELDVLLKEKPHLTFDQAFKEIQQIIELVALVAFKAFRG